jgi:hypothetical protein
VATILNLLSAVDAATISARIPKSMLANQTGRFGVMIVQASEYEKPETSVVGQFGCSGCKIFPEWRHSALPIPIPQVWGRTPIG